MTNYLQIYSLFKQEIKRAIRSRYVIFSFVLLPILMWSIQGGMFIIFSGAISSEDEKSTETLFITNNATEIITISLSENFTLPFDFEENLAGTQIDEIKLSNYLIAVLEHESKNNKSIFFGINIISNESFAAVKEKSEEGNIKNWIQIPNNFTEIYSTFNITSVEYHHFSSGLMGSTVFKAKLDAVLTQPPFTIVEVKKATYIISIPISISGEETGFNLGVGLAGFLGIIIAVIAPAPFVSSSMAGEREKKTLEALLALPISRRMILLGKLSAGMALVGIFAIVNIIAMYFNNYLNELVISGESGSNIAERASMGMLDLTPLTILSITVAISLTAFIAIGLGISIASLTKDVRTSEALYQIVMLIPAMLTGIISMFAGVPESLDGEGVLILYLIPWTHSIAIFIKISSPSIYNLPSQSLTGLGLIGDLIFHLGALFITIIIVITIASKIFEREGIVN